MCKPDKIKNYVEVEFPDGRKAILGELAPEPTPTVEDCKNEFAEAMNVIAKYMLEDQSPGSIFFVWQSGLACLLKDNTDLSMGKCNELAIKWLNRLFE